MQGVAPQKSATKRILIVEDNPLNMKLLRDVLEAHGYETIATGEGGRRSPSRASTSPI